MSELRDACENFLREQDFELCSNGRPYVYQVSALEAFAKEQRLKALEEVRPMMSKLWVAAGSNMDRHEEYMAWIDAEIAKLKEGG